MTLVRKAYLDTPEGQIHYRWAGDKQAPGVVLFHESPLSGQVYELVLPLLGQHFWAIAPDTPGYGESEGTSEPREIPYYASRLIEFIRGLGLTRCALVGTHTGASLAIEAAYQAPELVEKLVLSGVPLYTPDERKHMQDNWTPPFTPVADGSHLQWVWQRYQGIYGASSSPELLNSAVAQFLKAGERYHWVYQAVFRYDPEPALRTLQQPVFHLIAEHDLLAGKHEEAMAMTRNCKAEVVPDLPGQLPMRVPELFSRLVDEFLRS